MRKLFFIPEDVPWQEVCEKPLVVMGAVPAQEGDQGGGFVVAKGLTPFEGAFQRLSLEQGHFETSQFVPFFNPSLFFVEPFSSSFCEKLMRQSQDWLVIKRQYKGQNVFYKERLLYEMLSQSAFFNTLIVALPRELFKPNKTLSQTILQQVFS
jgi:hypothetical protein